MSSGPWRAWAERAPAEALRFFLEDSVGLDPAGELEDGELAAFELEATDGRKLRITLQEVAGAGDHEEERSGGD